jgi:hypothetical protein
MVPELRPRGIGEILDLAVSLYRTSFRRIVLLSAIVVLPVQVLSTLVLLSAQPEDTGLNLDFTGAAAPDYDIENLMLQLAASFVLLFVGLVSSAFVVGLCSRPVADTYVGTAGRWKRGSIGGRGFVAVLTTALLFALTQFAGAFVCGVGIYAAATLFAVAMPVVVLEGVGPTKALGRSLHLTKQHFFRVLGIVVSAQALETVLNLGLAAAITAWLFNSSHADGAVLVQGLATAAGALITEPFLATVMVVVYFDVRIREEGFDVQLLMQRNDERHAA